MTDTTASFYGVTTYNGRNVPRGDVRRAVRGAVIGFGTVAAAGTAAATALVAAAWIASTALSTNSHIYARTQMGPGSFAIAGRYPAAAGAKFDLAPELSDFADVSDTSFEAKWARARVPASASASAVPLLPQLAVQVAVNVPLVPLPTPRPTVRPQIAQAAALTHVASLAPAAAPASGPPRTVPLPPKRPAGRANVPLPLPQPVKHEFAWSEGGKPPAQVAMAAPPPPAEPRVPPPVPDKLVALPGPGSRIAVYDIAAHTVYLPNGEKLEAHSGFGDKLDNPRYANVRMRGPTPPNVYDLTLREKSFHGVRAIRLNPVDDDKMFGRDGMLAHTYMLGSNGQSNGCLSFKDYSKFLQAYLKGEVERLVVVARLDNTPVRTARARRAPADRYAFNNQ
jgi:hypothetical protein